MPIRQKFKKTYKERDAAKNMGKRSIRIALY